MRGASGTCKQERGSRSLNEIPSSSTDSGRRRTSSVQAQTKQNDWWKPRRSRLGPVPLPLPGEEHYRQPPGVPQEWFRGPVRRLLLEKESLYLARYPCALWKFAERKCAVLL